MEVKVFRKKSDGGISIESHSIPAYVGGSVTAEGPRGAETTNDADSVSDVVETVEVGPGVGVVLWRRVARRLGMGWREEAANGTGGHVIVTPEELASSVARVEVDGEQVWPEPDDDDGDAADEPGPTHAPEPEGLAEELAQTEDEALSDTEPEAVAAEAASPAARGLAEAPADEGPADEDEALIGRIMAGLGMAM